MKFFQRQRRVASWDASQDPQEYINFREPARAALSFERFPTAPPANVPEAVEIEATKLNHACMELGWIEYELGKGLKKGDTGAMYGDDFCLVHAITRVFVIDLDNHVVALVSPMRYMMYIAYTMYAKDEPKGNIFNFAERAAAPRWALRAAAKQILAGQEGSVREQGDGKLCISAVTMDKDGKCGMSQPVLPRVPISSMSWVVMDKWLQQARSHYVSFVVADTKLEVDHEKSKSLPLCVREDESDLIMAELVTGIEDERYAECGSFSKDSEALQFRGGWYAPKTPYGLTRIQKRAFQGTDESWEAEKTGTYSNQAVAQPSSALWFIGGIDDFDENAKAKNVGSHMAALNELDMSKGGLQNTKA